MSATRRHGGSPVTATMNRKRLRPLLVLLFGIAALAAFEAPRDAVGQPVGPTQTGPVRDVLTAMRALDLARGSGDRAAVVADATFVSRTVWVDESRVADYVACLEGVHRPVWLEARRSGRLLGVTVYEVRRVLSAQPGVPGWNFLVVARVASPAAAKAFVDGEASLEQLRRDADPPFFIRRVEMMQATPNSYYPDPTAANAARAGDAVFHVEYIDVHHTPDALERYRELMRQSIGPDAGELVQTGVDLRSLRWKRCRCCPPSRACPPGTRFISLAGSKA